MHYDALHRAAARATFVSALRHVKVHLKGTYYSNFRAFVFDFWSLQRHTTALKA